MGYFQFQIAEAAFGGQSMFIKIQAITNQPPFLAKVPPLNFWVPFGYLSAVFEYSSPPTNRTRMIQDWTLSGQYWWIEITVNAQHHDYSKSFQQSQCRLQIQWENSMVTEQPEGKCYLGQLDLL
jgi:hypothetical protein